MKADVTEYVGKKYWTQARNEVSGTSRPTGRSCRSLSRTSEPPLTLAHLCASSLSQLRRQVGTLRFDLNNLADAKGSGKFEVTSLVKSVRPRPPPSCAALYMPIPSDRDGQSSVMCRRGGRGDSSHASAGSVSRGQPPHTSSRLGAK